MKSRDSKTNHDVPSPDKSVQRTANHEVLGRGRGVSAPCRAACARVLTGQSAAAELGGQVAGEHSGMVHPLPGGCACGEVRYVCASAPIAMINCHCRDCQRSSGAPFASGVVVLASDVQVTGTPATHAVRGSSGNPTVRSFCATCGSPLFAQSAAANGFL